MSAGQPSCVRYTTVITNIFLENACSFVELIGEVQVKLKGVPDGVMATRIVMWLERLETILSNGTGALEENTWLFSKSRKSTAHLSLEAKLKKNRKRSKGKLTINHHAYRLISCLWRPIVTNKQAQKKQQKTKKTYDVICIPCRTCWLAVDRALLSDSHPSSVVWICALSYIFPWKCSLLKLYSLYQLSLRSTRFQLL